jgi:hypothetical protein
VHATDEPEVVHAADPKSSIPLRPISHDITQSTSQPERSTEVSQPQSVSKWVRPSEILPPEPPADPKPQGAIRDIKLQVASGPQQRVEVRLTERAGEVQVAVRTPDPHLAGTLRENLPTLSTRLADSGFRAETWHPSASGTEWRRSTETSQGNLTQDQNNQNFGGQQERQQSGDDPRRPKAPETPTERKQKGKDFAWLMSTLQ